MLNIPYAQQQQSKIAIVESRITNIDKNIIKVLQLFSITGQLDDDIESIRLTLSEMPKFYPEAIFAYLKGYTQKQENENTDFFDFSAMQNQKPFIANIINSSREGLIPYDNILLFLKQNNYITTSECLKQVEKQHHTDQHTFSQNEVIDDQFHHYPLPPAVEQQRRQKLMDQQVITKLPFPQKTNEEVLNSGEGVNYQTFLKLILPQSIPLAKQKMQKRKLIYETNQTIEIDIDIQQKVAKLLQFEVELFIKSEKIRIDLAHDDSYNHVTMFNLLDAHGNGEIVFNYIEQLMSKAQIPFKPKNFSAIVRRCHLLSNNNSLQEQIAFEDYRQIASVQSPYFKYPRKVEESTSTTVQYSRILGAEVGVSRDSGQLSLSRIPDKLKNQQQNYQSAQIPLYYSKTPNVNEIISRQSKTPKQDYNNLPNDYIIYGTKKEWEELQHTLGGGGQDVQSKSLKSQIQKLQNSNLNQSQEQKARRQSFTSNTPKNYNNKVDQIAGEARMQDLDQRNKELISKQLQQARNANTKGYYQNNLPPQVPNRNSQNMGQRVKQAPWYSTDRNTENKIQQMQRQQDDIQKIAGINSTPNPIISRGGFHSNRQYFEGERLQPSEMNRHLPQSPQQIEIDYKNPFSQINPPQQQQQQQQQSNIQRPNQRQSEYQNQSRIFQSQQGNELVYNDINKSKIMDYRYEMAQRRLY